MNTITQILATSEATGLLIAGLCISMLVLFFVLAVAFNPRQPKPQAEWIMEDRRLSTEDKALAADMTWMIDESDRILRFGRANGWTQDQIEAATNAVMEEFYRRTGRR